MMWQAARYIGAYLARYPWRVVGMLCALVVTSGSVLAMGQGLAKVIDQGFIEANAHYLNHALVGLLGLICLLAFATFARSYLIHTLCERVIADLRSEIFAHVLLLPPSFFDSQKTSEVLSRLTNDATLLSGVIVNVISVALRNILLLIGGIIMLMLTSMMLTSYMLILVPVVVAPILLLGKKVRRWSRLSQDSIASLSGYMEESLLHLRTLQAYSGETHAVARCNHYIEEAFAIATQRTWLRSLLIGMVITLIFTAIGFILWQGSTMVLAKTLSPGALSSFVFYAVLVAGSVGALSEIISDLQRAVGAAERLQELNTMPSAITSPLHPIRLPQIKGAITLEKVSFSYPTRPGTNVLSDFELEIKPGETVAFVGRSGSGKSTLFQLLLRFYDPTSGRILLDQTPLRSLALDELRTLFAWVSQDPAIFSTTIHENILFGRPDATKEEVLAAAKAAEVLEFAEALPEGLECLVGERGQQLSGGQRQRLSIARAILKNPRILLLDEATSHLDAENEQLVQRAIEHVMHGRTTLVIAHRLSTILKADRIVVIEQGKIQAIGTHQELLKTSEIYARLVRLQFGQRDEIA